MSEKATKMRKKSYQNVFKKVTCGNKSTSINSPCLALGVILSFQCGPLGKWVWHACSRSKHVSFSASATLVTFATWTGFSWCSKQRCALHTPFKLCCLCAGCVWWFVGLDCKCILHLGLGTETRFHIATGRNRTGLERNVSVPPNVSTEIFSLCRSETHVKISPFRSPSGLTKTDVKSFSIHSATTQHLFCCY